MQQDLKRKLIAKSFHRFAQDALTTAKITFGPSPSAEFQTKKVPKYAPRYIKELPVNNLKDAKLVKALKRVKVIESVSDESASENIGNRWRIALQNKLKTVMKYKPDKFEWKSIEKYKAFSKITNVILHDEARKKGLKGSKKRSTSFSWNLLKWIPGMVNLRCLDFHMKNAYPGTLKRLNSVIPNRTFSLKTVRISLETSQNAFLSFIGGDGNVSPLSSLIENKNILERLTHLDLNNIRGKDFLSNFELISKNCKNIVSLSMGFSDKNEMKSLKLLKDFEKLEYVRLCLEDLLVLLENFALPPSVKDIEISCFNSEDPNNYGEVRSQSLLDFGEKWKHLTNLTSLKMLAGHNPEAAGFIQSFVMMILTNVPSLVSFQFELIDAFKGFDNDNDENNDMGMQSFDVNNIFKALQGVSNQIKEIKISYPQTYTLTCSTEENLDLSFPKLELLQLPANTIENVETISNIFCALRKPFLAEDNVTIQLDAFVVNSESTLVNLIETLRRSPRNSTTEMTIRIEIFEFKMLEEFIEKVRKEPIVQNVGLTVKIPSELYDEITLALSFLEEIFAYVSFESDLEENFFF